ncbi:MAG TPA: tRNA (adenosine(37)-N6)-dimethylallyltransferase MiaA [Sphingomicrobium sp.]|nr:tRNA (adenosine(37)-N6)-dimethylallyltransferase MiaA [Sphingomicrobium sp.]
MSKSRPPVAVIAGPTASGKSALAVELAERTNGTVINADSAQVYADLRVLSARPGEADLQRAPHRLFGTWDAATPCSAADWAEAARHEIATAHGAGKLPVLVGGTGLYLRTLLEGIAPVPQIDPAVREAVRQASVAENHRQLSDLDPAAARRLHPADTTRVARALEVIRATGRTLTNWQADRHGGIAHEVQFRAIVLLPPREWLYRRCDQRFAAMLLDGAVPEVRALLARNLDPDLPAMLAIGVREVAALIRGECSREQAIASGAQATRNYAKRQYTWFKHQPPPEWPRFSEPPAGVASTERALALLGARV